MEYTSLYAYLESTGVLDAGTSLEIAAAKQKYWKDYRAAYQRQKRKECYTVTVVFNNKEMKILTAATEKHQMNHTAFVRQATLAYCQQQFVIVDREAANIIKSLLIKNYTLLQNIEENGGEQSTSLLLSFEKLEREVLTALVRPELLLNSLLEGMAKNPALKTQIIQLINSK